MNELISLVCFVSFAVAFAVMAIVVSWIVSPKTDSLNKKTNYECGVPLFSNSRIQYTPDFLVYAIVFVIFEIESLFLFPFAVVFSKIGLFALVETIIFVLILLLGLFYFVKKMLKRRECG